MTAFLGVDGCGRAFLSCRSCCRDNNLFDLNYLFAYNGLYDGNSLFFTRTGHNQKGSQ